MVTVKAIAAGVLLAATQVTANGWGNPEKGQWGANYGVNEHGGKWDDKQQNNGQYGGGNDNKGNHDDCDEEQTPPPPPPPEDDCDEGEGGQQPPPENPPQQGGGNTDCPPAETVTVTVTMTADATDCTITDAPSSTTAPPEAVPTTWSVTAGVDGLKFNPPKVTAKKGDVVEWHFNPANHTVAQSNFADPCQPLPDNAGFAPGFNFAVMQGESDNVFQITIEDDSKPIWYYCPQPGKAPGMEHCKSGMIGVINEKAESGNTLEKQMTLLADAKLVIPAENGLGEVIAKADLPKKAE